MNFRQKAIVGVRWTSLSTIVLAITQLLTTAIMTRFLIKSDFGLMAIALFVKGFADLFMDFGITVAVLHKQNITTNEYSSLYWINMLIGFVLYLILWLITPFITGFYNEKELLTLIPLMCLAIPISSIGRLQKTVLQKELYFKEVAIVDIIASVVSFGIAIYLAITSKGVYALVFSNLARYALSNIIYFFVGIKLFLIKFHFSFKETLSFFKIGIYNTIGQIINYFSSNFDVLIIGKLLGTDSLGIYNLAKDLVIKPASVVTPIISRVVTPLFAKVQDEKDCLLSNFFLVQKIIAFVNAYIYIIFSILAYFIVCLYYGETYSNTASIVSILALYCMLREYGQPMSMVCVAKGRTDIDMWWNLLVLCVSPLFVAIGSFYSLEIIALFLLLFVLIMLYPAWYMYAKRLLGISCYAYYKSLLSALKLFLLPTLISLIFILFVEYSVIWMLITGIIIFTVFTCLSFYLFDKTLFIFTVKYFKTL